MKKRLVAILALVAVAFGLFAAVQLGLVYNATITAAAANEAAAIAGDPKPRPPVVPIDPNAVIAEAAEDQPVDVEAEATAEAENHAGWMAMQQFTDQCMEEAGFPEYTYNGDPTGEPTESSTMPHARWSATLPAERQAAGDLAEWGDSAAGADYNWEDAGCQGYGVHMIGNDDQN